MKISLIQKGKKNIRVPYYKKKKKNQILANNMSCLLSFCYVYMVYILLKVFIIWFYNNLMKQKTPHTQQGKYLDGDELMWYALYEYMDVMQGNIYTKAK